MGRLHDAWHLLNLPCLGMTRLTSESLDRDLGRLERFALRTHWLYCAPCRRYARQVRSLHETLRGLARGLEADGPDLPTPPPPLPDDVRERIKRVLREN